MEKAYVVFDMDGVIFDSETCIVNEWKIIAEKYGIKDLLVPLMKCIGTNHDTTRRIMLDYFGPDFPYDEYNEEKHQAYDRKYSGGRLPLKKGIRELLAHLKGRGYHIAIASSSPVEKVRTQIRDAGLLEFFSVIIGGDMVKESKPHPEIFLTAARGLGARAEECYVIEDSLNGIRAAYSAGMTPIMVPDLVEPTEEMHQKAAYILSDLLEVRDKVFS